jgi:hypothetical protein
MTATRNTRFAAGAFAVAATFSCLYAFAIFQFAESRRSTSAGETITTGASSSPRVIDFLKLEINYKDRVAAGASTDFEVVVSETRFTDKKAEQNKTLTRSIEVSLTLDGKTEVKKLATGAALPTTLVWAPVVGTRYQ